MTRDLLEDAKRLREARRARSHADTSPAPVSMEQMNGLATSTNLALDDMGKTIGRLKLVIVCGFAAQVILVLALFALVLWHHQTDISALGMGHVCR